MFQYQGGGKHLGDKHKERAVGQVRQRNKYLADVRTLHLHMNTFQNFIFNSLGGNNFLRS